MKNANQLKRIAAVALAACVLLAAGTTALAQEFRLSASDGWHDLAKLAPGTWAITEPRSALQNVSYVIEGKDRAILFDAGTGHDIRGMVMAATRLPVTVVPSHAHHDHVGNIERFETIALPDLPVYREQTEQGWWTPGFSQSLSLRRPTVEVDEWIAPGSTIDLGGRELVLVAVPGHSPDSIVLVEPAAGRLFSGDILFPGDIRAYLPGSDFTQLRESVTALRRDYPSIEHVHGGHGAPAMQGAALAELEAALEKIASGEAAGRRQWWSAGMATRYEFSEFAIVAP